MQSAIDLKEPQRGVKYAGFFRYDCPLRVIDAVGPIAQSVEQRTFNPWVVGSIPTGPTSIIEKSIYRASAFKTKWIKFFLNI